MPNVILHIGQMKTGSTAIQVSLRKGQDRLRAAGILYPPSDYSKNTHHALLPLFVDREKVNQFIVNAMGFNRESIVERARAEWSNVLQSASGPEISTVVLSGEALFRSLSETEADRLVAALGQLGDDVRVLCYVRNPATHYLSRVQQFLKVRARLLQPSENPFLAPLVSYAKAFGPALECRVFDRSLLNGGDVVKDFLEWSGLKLESGLEIVADVNRSVSAEAMSVLNRLGQAEAYPSSPAAAEKQKHLFKLVEAADRLLPSPTKPKLRSSAYQSLIERNEELVPLKNIFGLAFPDVDYSTAGRSSHLGLPNFQIVEQLCGFDEDRRNRLEKTVRRKLVFDLHDLPGADTLRRLRRKLRRIRGSK